MEVFRLASVCRIQQKRGFAIRLLAETLYESVKAIYNQTICNNNNNNTHLVQ